MLKLPQLSISCQQTSPRSCHIWSRYCSRLRLSTLPHVAPPPWYHLSNNSQSPSSSRFLADVVAVGAMVVVGVDEVVHRLQITCGPNGCVLQPGDRTKLSHMAAALCRSSQPSQTALPQLETLTIRISTNATTIGTFVSRVGLTSKMGTPLQRAPSKRQIINSHSLARMCSNSLMRVTTRAPRGCTRRSCLPIGTLDGVGRS